MKLNVRYSSKELKSIPDGKDLTDWFNDLNGTQARRVTRLLDDGDDIILQIVDVPEFRLKSTKGFIKTFSSLDLIKSFCRTKSQRLAFNKLIKSFDEDNTEKRYRSRIERTQDKINNIKDDIADEMEYVNSLKSKLNEAFKDRNDDQEYLKKYKERKSEESSETTKITKTTNIKQ